MRTNETTYGQLLAGVWNEERFADVAHRVVSPAGVYRLAQLGLAGWSFCGATMRYLELERDGELLQLDPWTGDVITVESKNANWLAEGAEQ